MTPEKAEALYAHLQAISAILYEETPSENSRTLEEIEQTVRQKVLKHLFAQKLVFYFIQAVTGTTKGRKRRLKSSINILKLTENQVRKLDVEPDTQLSPHLEKCCLLLSANVSYENSAQDLETLTGLTVSHSTQQRLLQRYEFTEVTLQPTGRRVDR